jgi:TPP-dependent trihydroxycyclohexane-1,2-dione (THcHDO) dehydratase
MIESKRPVEERAAEVVGVLQRKREQVIKAGNAVQLAEAKANLARLDYANSLKAAQAKFPEAVQAAGLGPVEG